jgi:hypothetical protein
LRFNPEFGWQERAIFLEKLFASEKRSCGQKPPPWQWGGVLIGSDWGFIGDW